MCFFPQKLNLPLFRNHYLIKNLKSFCLSPQKYWTKSNFKMLSRHYFLNAFIAHMESALYPLFKTPILLWNEFFRFILQGKVQSCWNTLLHCIFNFFARLWTTISIHVSMMVICLMFLGPLKSAKPDWCWLSIVQSKSILHSCAFNILLQIKIFTVSIWIKESG